MLNCFKMAGLSVKISLLGAISVLAAAASLLVLAAWQSSQYNALSQKEVYDLINADLDHITMGVYNLVQVENEAVQQEINDNLRVARHVLTADGAISLGKETARWNLINKAGNVFKTVKLPQLLVGGRWLGMNDNPAVKTPIVDEISALVGETSTIFQRMNERGDMLRVATTVQSAGGRRVIGTYIPAVNPDGTKNPIIAAILKGKTYRGRAFVVKEWYITAYEPITDQSGKLAGMLYVGSAQKDAEARVRQAILKTHVGKTGYIYVLGGKGAERGKYIVSQRGERDGENIWEAKDSDGRLIVQIIINAAVKLKPETLGNMRYRWQNPEDTTPRWKTVRLAYYEPWDWVIGASVYDDELMAYKAVLDSGRKRMMMIMGIAGVAIAFLIGITGIFVARTITRPVREMTRAAETIIKGKLTQVTAVNSQDEIGVLAGTFNFMTAWLAQTIEGLRRSEEEFRSLFENALEGIFQSSVDGSVLRANPALARMLGYESPSEIEQAVTDIAQQIYYRDEDRADIIRTIHEQGYVLGREIRFYRKDRQIIWISLSAVIISDNAGQPLYLQGYITDISARKQAELERANLEEQLLQAQKMESVGRLAGGVAHDFNNMLQVIIGNASFALDGMPPEDPLKEFLEEIQKSAQRSADLTGQLLAFARKQTIHPQILDLNAAINSILKMLQRLIGENIQLIWMPGRDLWLVKFDPTQINQILANLIVNARDAITGVGKIDIQTCNETLDVAYAANNPEVLPGEYVILIISDTGKGMSKEVRRHLFEPFFTTKELGKGTGLGLSTVFGIMKQNSGFVNVYSEPGLGTTFKLYFPRTEAEMVAVVQPADKFSQRGTETLLVVEDEEQILNLTRRILLQQGYTVITASSPGIAINLAAQQVAIHMLITDVIMPGMNGKELYIRLMEKFPALKCLYTSGYTANVIAHHGILDEGVAFLPKPFSARALASKVREVLDGVRPEM